jgi:hypothetical protein
MPAGTVVSRGYLAVVDGICGRVHAAFERCAYVTVNRGPSLVLHAAGGDHTPTSLCPATWPPAATAVAAGDAVAGRAGHLRIGELVLDVRGARVWRPAPPPQPTARLAEAGARVRAVHELALRGADRRTGEVVPRLARALARRDAEHVARRVRALVGLGPGLTPSGDDALVGLLAALHRLSRAGDDLLALLGQAVACDLHRTCDISAHYLRLAVAGHVGERLIALCDALADGTDGDVDEAAAAVAATGATSGADALLGVVAGVRLMAAINPAAVAA